MVELPLDRLKMHLYLFSFLLLFFFEGCTLSGLNLFSPKEEKKVVKTQKETTLAFTKSKPFPPQSLPTIKTPIENTTKRPKKHLKIEMIDKDEVKITQPPQITIASSTLLEKKREQQLIALKKLKLSQLLDKKSQEEVLQKLKKEKEAFYKAQQAEHKREQQEEFAYLEQENKKIIMMHQEAEKLLQIKNKNVLKRKRDKRLLPWH